MCRIKGSGSCNSRDNQEPIIAPINPTMIEIMHPPREKPDNERAIDPAKPAISRDIRMSIIFDFYLLYNYSHKLYFIKVRINNFEIF